MQQDTLLIAPDNAGTLLPNMGTEIREIVLSLNALPLTGHVTSADVLRTIAEGRNVLRRVFFATHGDENGILLSDGVALSTSELTMDLRNVANLELVVLNTCASETIALNLHADLHTNVIATITAVPDTLAWRTTAWLARNLAKGMSIAAAFESSRPGQDRIYRLFAAQRPMDKSDAHHITAMITQLGEMLSRQIGDVDRRLVNVERKFDERINDLEQRFSAQLDTLAAAVPQRTGTRRWAWLLAWALLVGAAVLFFKDLRDLLNLTWQVAFVLVLGGWSLSALFFAYGLDLIQDPRRL
jgi:hypothetical protein